MVGNQNDQAKDSVDLKNQIKTEARQGSDKSYYILGYLNHLHTIGQQMIDWYMLINMLNASKLQLGLMN